MSMSQKILEGASEAVGSDVVNFLDIFSISSSVVAYIYRLYFVFCTLLFCLVCNQISKIRQVIYSYHNTIIHSIWRRGATVPYAYIHFHSQQRNERNEKAQSQIPAPRHNQHPRANHSTTTTTPPPPPPTKHSAQLWPPPQIHHHLSFTPKKTKTSTSKCSPSNTLSFSIAFFSSHGPPPPSNSSSTPPLLANSSFWAIPFNFKLIYTTFLKTQT